jgi:glycine cleavage system protein P-like pyridoxal-binding family
VPIPNLPRQHLLSPRQRLQSQLQQRRIRLLFITRLPPHSIQPLLQNNRRPLHNTHLLRHLTQLHLMHLTLHSTLLPLHSAHPLLYCTHLLLRPPRPQL